MAKTPYTRLTTSAFNTLNSSTLGTLKPYQIRQVMEFLDAINWGKANGGSGKGSDSDVSNQPTLAQIVTLAGRNNA
jgi:hypothetical protein